jgi:PIN domain nuclease of toxin-antitoxin system
MTPERPLLLDTHALVWSVDGPRREMRATVYPEIERAAAEARAFVSVMSIWELALLDAARRISLSTDIHAWIAIACRPPGMRIAELTPEIAIASTRLPGDIHRDPADRIIVATARQLGATLVTRDRRLLDYGAAGHLAVLDASPEA